MKAYVDSVVAIPVSGINLAQVRNDCKVKWTPMGEKESITVRSYHEDSGYIYVPRDYGLKLISTLGFSKVDRMSRGSPAYFPKNVKHTGQYEYQDGIVNQILTLAEEKHDFLFRAATGKGKTVMSLSVAQKRGRTTLVLVDQENLLKQWVAEAKLHLGLDDEHIGIIQGPRCDYEGKSIVVGMMQSLTRRDDYPEEMFDYFGTVVVDEAHTAGAPTFSQVLGMFSASFRFGVSATMDRRDALQKLIHMHMGDIDVVLTDEHDPSYVYYLESKTVYSWYANISPKTGRFITEVSEDADRNELLLFAIRWLYYSGRETLVISDRIEQLESLRDMMIAYGYPEEDLGLYTGFRTKWCWVKNPTPDRHPQGWVEGTEYTPIMFAPVRKKIPKKELDRVRAECRVIFATFGMFTKGVDEKRLNGGVDCTPRARAEQVHGRILRVKEDKLIPIWVTVRDINSVRAENQFYGRISEYRASNGEIYKWQPSQGVRFMDVAELRRSVKQNLNVLKHSTIQTSADGRNMLLIPTTLQSRDEPRASPTARRTRSRPANSGTASVRTRRAAR